MQGGGGYRGGLVGKPMVGSSLARQSAFNDYADGGFGSSPFADVLRSDVLQDPSEGPTSLRTSKTESLSLSRFFDTLSPAPQLLRHLRAP